MLVVIGVPLAVLFASGGGDEPRPKPQPQRATALRVERGTGGSELII